MASVKIDSKRFYSRLNKIYENFADSASNPQSVLKDLDVILLVRGKHNPEDIETTQKTTSKFHEYLIGYDFTECLILITSRKTYFLLASKKKLYLEEMSKPPIIKCPDIDLTLRNPSSDNTQVLTSLFERALTEAKSEKFRVGYLSSESGKGNLVSELEKAKNQLKDKLEFIDSPYMIEELLKRKDNEEVANVQIASRYACYLMRLSNNRFVDAIEDEKKVTHAQIGNKVEQSLSQNDVIEKFLKKNEKLNVDKTLLELRSNPLIQSGVNCTTDLFISNDSNMLSQDVIICKCVGNYNNYYGEVVRTFMISTGKYFQKLYKVLYEAFDKLLSLLSENAVLGDIYKKVKEDILSKDDSLSDDNIPDNFGFLVGMEKENSIIRLTEKNTFKVKKGMVFSIVLGLVNINKEGKKYVIQIGDTVLINSDNQAINLTKSFSKELNDVYYDFKKEEEEEEIDDNITDEKGLRSLIFNSDHHITRGAMNKLKHKEVNTEQRKAHQKLLLKQKNEEFRKKVESGIEEFGDETEDKRLDLTGIQCYKSKSEYPEGVFAGKIYVDPGRFAVFLPLFKKMVPFHIAQIKNTTKSEDGGKTLLRINFLVPQSGVSFGEESEKEGRKVFIREVSYRLRDAKFAASITTQIKNLQKEYKGKLIEEKEKKELVKQEHLILRKDRKIVLNDVEIRPKLSAKKVLGNLEAHQNGFRFITNRMEKCEIIYSNIKQAFFQPCENDLRVLIHFHLKNPIMVGKKKTIDVQFFKELAGQNDDIGPNNRRDIDYEEYEMELKEKEIKEKMNNDFLNFSTQVEDLKVLQFDVPRKEMEFTGVTYKTSVNLRPTQHCLVSLSDPPPFVVTLSEVDIVYFERVSQSLKNFDMVFIFKNLSTPFQRIGTIPMENLEMLKNWLDDNNILFGEGLYNIIWNKIIQKIKKEPREFIKEGAWDFIAESESEGSASEEDDGDPEYVESSESSDDDDDYEEEEEEESEEESEELSEEGKDWDEMEKEAIRDDRERVRRMRDRERVRRTRNNENEKKNRGEKNENKNKGKKN